TGTTGATGTTGSTGAAATPRFIPYSAVGEVSLSDNGTFVVREWIYSNGSVQGVTANGAYTVSQDCSLQLTFASGSAGGNVSFTAPVTFTGTLNRASGNGGRTTAASSGSLVIQPKNVTTVV